MQTVTPYIQSEAKQHRIVVDERGDAKVQHNETTLKWKDSEIPLIDEWDLEPGSYIWAVYNQFGICAFVTAGSDTNPQDPWDAWLDTQDCVNEDEAKDAIDKEGNLEEGYDFQANVKDGQTGVVNVGHDTGIVCLTVKRRLIEFD